MAVLEENIVEGDDELTVDGRPVVRVGGFDDEVAVEAHVEAVVLADVRVVPVQAGVGEAHLIGEVAADGDRVLGLVRHAVVVVETQSVPMHGRLGVGVVANANRDLRSLTHAQRRAGDRPVVGKHPNSVSPICLTTGAIRSSKASPSARSTSVGAMHSSKPAMSVENVVTGASTGVSCVVVIKVLVWCESYEWKLTPAAISAMRTSATTQSTQAQNGGHQRVLTTKWWRSCHKSLRPCPA